MLESLRMIPGPLFLLILVGLSALGIYLHFYRSWGANRIDPVAEMRLTPYELAYLARGPRGVIETALAAADAAELIRVDAASNLATPLPNAHTDDPILAELVKELKELEGTLRGLKLTASLDSLRQDLMEAGLLDRTTSGQVALRGFLIFGALEILALAKLFLGITHGRPVFFLALVVMAIFGLLVASLWTKGRRGFPTPAGRRCVEARRRALEPLLFDAQASRSRTDARPLMTSIFGFHELSTSLWASAIPIAAVAIAVSPLWFRTPVHAANGNFSGGDSDGGWFSSSSDSGCSGGSSDGGSSDSGCGGGSSGGDSGCGGGGGCGGCGGGGGD